ncbi:MAG: hypothetical protein GY708_13545, partial [Actinomycetia bacterium]|nr:hypothetical protein [Actinomycetes bacterium]
WSTGVVDPTFTPDPDAYKYDSDYQNYVYSVNQSTSGGGWLRKKTVTTEITTTTGEKDFYTHTLKADYDIDIDFIQGPSVPQISIYSVGDIVLNGNLNAAIDANDQVVNGTIDITSTAGSITQASSAFISAVDTTISSDGSQSVQIQGGISGSKGATTVVDTEVTGYGDILVNVVSDNQDSSIEVVRAIAHAGNVILAAADGIQPADSNSIIKGNRVELFTKRSGIGTSGLPLRVDSSYISLGGLTSTQLQELGIGGLTATVNATADVANAAESIYIDETDLDMVLVMPVSLPAIPMFSDITFLGSVVTANGNVVLRTDAGSVLDGTLELFSASESFDEDDLTAAQQQLIDDGIVTLDVFKYPLSPGLTSVLFPHAGFLGSSPSTSPAETPNVIGVDVELYAVGGQIGQLSDKLSIDLTGDFDLLGLTAKETLSIAAASDVIGVTYQLYQFDDSFETGVDLKLEDYSDTNRWTAITVYPTGVDDQQPVPLNSPHEKYVLVQYDQARYGIYRCKVNVASLDLSDQDYNNTGRWEPIRPGGAVHATDDDTSVTATYDTTLVEYGNVVYKYMSSTMGLAL